VRWIVGTAITLFLLCPVGASGNFPLPPEPPPHLYGNLLISRTMGTSGIRPASFSHWSHRRRYTCQVCHSELEFAFQANATEITEAENKAGKYCGACHNGRTAFGHEEAHCDKCHNGDLEYGAEKFSELAGLPASKNGNRVDWTKALEEKRITPASFLSVKPSSDISYDKTLTLKAEWAFISPAIFPHKKHTDWLECNSCHPDIFNIRKKTTKHFEMTRILKGEFCGVCHMNVAFPIRDCKRCHPSIRRSE
jgi:c(7)-type cytochrome triheme protein